ncbi:hypothetical protein M758_1G163900 [Ceratodon purpureus]|uniref:Stigma-specific STIG1-like protein 1 n=2 Tax=Ceratodon purpureus TaxID=3225 RepID=A0A8T0J8N7_CERPU|nr:hypothetical protein KC19_1G168100 [Ceratodon purpureus]KAG0630235.1 hypothetical protein M758_1G163900 [Ceratodon purpureus]
MEFRKVNFKLNMNTVPKVWLLLVVISALWLVSVSATDSDELDFEDKLDTTPWISTRQPGRFLLQNGGRNPQRRNWCGGGRAPNFACRLILPWPEFRNPQCCWTRNNNRRCFDVGADNDLRCGSCTRSCRPSGRKCCGGVCVDLLSDRNNCGRCGNRCRGRVRCQNGICGYNGGPRGDGDD